MNNTFFKKLGRGAFFFLVTLALISSLLPLTSDRMVVQAQTDLADIQVGVYNGLGADDDCTTALYNLLAWMGPTVTYVDHTNIHNGILNTLDMLAFPGGSPNLYAEMCGDLGVQLIRQFVENGGSYFGICGGGMFATWTLDFYQGVWTPLPGMTLAYQLIDLDVNQASTGPDLSDEPATYQVLYWGSHYYTPTNTEDIIPVMTYAANDGVALCVSRYGSGTTFICGPHPEFEEGSDRDGTDRFDYLDDPDSEWGLLEKVTQWLIDESPDNPQPNPLGGFGGILLVVGITIVIVVAGTAFFLVRRRNRAG